MHAAGALRRVHDDSHAPPAKNIQRTNGSPAGATCTSRLLQCRREAHARLTAASALRDAEAARSEVFVAEVDAWVGGIAASGDAVRGDILEVCLPGTWSQDCQPQDCQHSRSSGKGMQLLLFAQTTVPPVHTCAQMEARMAAIDEQDRAEQLPAKASALKAKAAGLEAEGSRLAAELAAARCANEQARAAEEAAAASAAAELEAAAADLDERRQQVFEAARQQRVNEARCADKELQQPGTGLE